MHISIHFFIVFFYMLLSHIRGYVRPSVRWSITLLTKLQNLLKSHCFFHVYACLLHIHVSIGWSVQPLFYPSDHYSVCLSFCLSVLNHCVNIAKFIAKSIEINWKSNITHKMRKILKRKLHWKAASLFVRTCFFFFADAKFLFLRCKILCKESNQDPMERSIEAGKADIALYLAPWIFFNQEHALFCLSSSHPRLKVPCWPGAPR